MAQIHLLKEKSPVYSVDNPQYLPKWLLYKIIVEWAQKVHLQTWYDVHTKDMSSNIATRIKGIIHWPTNCGQHVEQ